jgi:hypothetical protein
LEPRGSKKVHHPSQAPPVHRNSTPELTTIQTQQRNNTNEPARDSRRPLHRQCQRLRRLARRRGTHPAALPGDDLQIPIHGTQHPAPSSGPSRKDPRYQEDIRRGAVLEDAERSRSPHRSYRLMPSFQMLMVGDADKLLLNPRNQLRVKRYPLCARANLPRRHRRSIPLARGERHARVPRPRG